LDTINRTYRNIDIAVSYQAERVDLLTSRLKQLKLPSNQFSFRAFTRDNRLPDVKRSYSRSPSILKAAANALNGERSAAKLKSALLSVRQQPLLNTTATIAPAAPIAFNTPRKTFAKTEPESPSIGFNSVPFSPSEPEQSPAWNSVTFDEPQPHDLGPRRRGGRKHGFAKKTPVSSPSPSASAQSPPAPSFDWGPLPTVAPKKGLPFGFNKSPSPSK
jgi:nucleoporin NUP159